MEKLKFDDSLFGQKVTRPMKVSAFTTETPEELSNHERECPIDIDFNEFNPSAVDTGATFIKGDRYTSIFKARLVKNKIPIDLEGTTITANIREGKNGVVTILCEDVDVETSTVSINLPPTLADEYGTNTFEVVIHKDDKVVVSQMYSYRINNSLGEGEAGSEEESSALQILIYSVENMRETLLRDIENTKNDFDSFVENKSEYLTNKMDGFNDRLDTMTTEFNQRVEDFTDNFVYTTEQIVEEYDNTLNAKIDNFNQIVTEIEQDLTIYPHDLDDIMDMIGGL